MKFMLFIFTMILMMVFPATLWAWDCIYDGSMLPNDLPLDTNKWMLNCGYNSAVSTDGNILNITNSGGTAYYSRDAVPGPITMEASVRITEASDKDVEMAIGSASFSTRIDLYPHYLQIFFDYGNPAVIYPADMTAFHTLRVAINAQGQSYVWLNQNLVAQGMTHSAGQGFLYFGAGADTYQGTSNSYWDYVAYSQSFDPIVPEPSSLIAIALGLAGLAIRRRM